MTLLKLAAWILVPEVMLAVAVVTCVREYREMFADCRKTY